jgi:DNA-directed RNA polymerase subunit RPC12/RpoP
MKILIDCPLCGVFMKPRATCGGGEVSFVCAHCGSKFLVNRKPKDEATKRHIYEALQNRTIPGEPSIYRKTAKPPKQS